MENEELLRGAQAIEAVLDGKPAPSHLAAAAGANAAAAAVAAGASTKTKATKPTVGCATLLARRWERFRAFFGLPSRPLKPMDVIAKELGDALLPTGAAIR
jgi:hypothetical protein